MKAAGLKIPVSAIRFRPWALKNKRFGERQPSTECASVHLLAYKTSTPVSGAQ
jgi:hypothetical protein